MSRKHTKFDPATVRRVREALREREARHARESILLRFCAVEEELTALVREVNEAARAGHLDLSNAEEVKSGLLRALDMLNTRPRITGGANE